MGFPAPTIITYFFDILPLDDCFIPLRLCPLDGIMENVKYFFLLQVSINVIPVNIALKLEQKAPAST
jgi:hypothetical protein